MKATISSYLLLICLVCLPFSANPAHCTLQSNRNAIVIEIYNEKTKEYLKKICEQYSIPLSVSDIPDRILLPHLSPADLQTINVFLDELVSANLQENGDVSHNYNFLSTQTTH